MLFSSITFLYYFLPITLIVYFLVPFKAKNLVLLLASLIFYFWGEPKFVLIMLASITTAYVFGLLMDHAKSKIWRKVWFILSCVVTLSFLLVFKYTDFLLTNLNLLFGTSIPLLQLVLPIGISFYTFQILSYTIDAYRGNVAVQKNYIKLATYVALFPQLIAGPIVRYSDVEKELSERTHSLEKFSQGAFRFSVGLGKKILIANLLGEFCNLYRESADKSVLFTWLYGIAFCLHIYFDFSGYSDMAIGLGRIFGFSFPENFNYPYVSRSATEFWRRWHMTLGSWFRDYVYIPLGGNRVKLPRWFFNIFVVWFLTGFWHGADWTFIVWGLLFAVLLVVEKLFFKKILDRVKPLGHVYLLFMVMISFIIFNANGMGEAIEDLKGLFSGPLVSAEAIYYLRSFWAVMLAGIVGCTPLVKKLALKIGANETAATILQPIVIVALLALCTAYLVDGSFNPFLYFRF